MDASAKATIKQTLLVGAFLAALALFSLIVVAIARIFLLIFAGILIGVFLHNCSEWIHKRIGVRYGLALTLVILAIVAFFGISAWFILPRFEAQISDLRLSIPQAITKLTSSGPGLRGLVGNAASGLNIAGRLGNLSGYAVDAVVIIFLSVYLAATPRIYRRGVVALTPVRARDSLVEMLDALQHMMWRWFIGRIIGMTVIGLLVYAVVRIVDLPLAFGLGIIAGVFEFVPYLGAIVSAIPAVLLALTISSTTAWVVIFLYLVVHGIDGYIVLPLVERRAVYIPPGVTIIAQIGMYYLAGLLGVLVADPLAATILVILQRFYMHREETGTA